MTLGLARSISGFADIPPEAKVAIQAVRRADVGVYALRGGYALDRSTVVNSCTESLIRKGWERAVCVIDDTEVALVFVPEGLSSEHDLDVCVLVVGGADLVVAKARLARKPLGKFLAMAMDHKRRNAPAADNHESGEHIEAADSAKEVVS